MDGLGGSDARFGETYLARECRAETQFQHSDYRGSRFPLWGSSGLNYVDARTLAAIPKLGEVNVWKPTPRGSWSNNKHIVVACWSVRINFACALHGD